jgi:3-phosphoshikimate 1-carboxyvinyltransferase
VQLKVEKSSVKGDFDIPGSKSHTVRAFFFGLLAHGFSTIRNPLLSKDASSAMEICQAFGANIVYHENENLYMVEGVNAEPRCPDNVLDVGNSGTTLRIALGVAALLNGKTIFTGDHQIRTRPIHPLMKSLHDLGARCESIRDNGSAPVLVQGLAYGGKTHISAVTSQYLTSLLMSTPFFQKDSHIVVDLLNERPYVEMTLWWLERLGIEFENRNFEEFYVKGSQRMKGFDMTIPGDFSTATFFMVLSAISGEEVVLKNLDMTDTQGDKEVLFILEEMGCKVTVKEGEIRLKGRALHGVEVDLNRMPDALPALAVAGTFAKGETKLYNVAQARLKETDRIKVMCQELKKLGADIEELEDGLVIRESVLKGTNVNGHYDHRVVMALAIAGLNIDGVTEIDTAEAMSITFPTFVDDIKRNGGKINLG